MFVDLISPSSSSSRKQRIHVISKEVTEWFPRHHIFVRDLYETLLPTVSTQGLPIPIYVNNRVTF